MELLLKAIADPTRALILDELVDRDGQTLFEICARLANKHGITPTRQAISQHLAVLEEAGLLRSERSGRYKFHYLDTSPLLQINHRWPQHGSRPPEGEKPADHGKQGVRADRMDSTETSSERTNS